MLNIISNIGYVLASLVFVYVIVGLIKEALRNRNKWLIVSIVLMVSVVAIALSEVL